MRKQNRLWRKPRNRERKGGKNVKMRAKQVLRNRRILGYANTAIRLIHLVPKSTGVSCWLSNRGWIDGCDSYLWP